MRVWEYGIPVVMKVRHAPYIVYVCVHATFLTTSVGCTWQYLNEPWMHSMPAITMSPNKKWLACQSMDNSIMMYEAARYRLNRKKRFTGHVCSGYACQPAFSNDNNYIYSGDGEGKLFVW